MTELKINKVGSNLRQEPERRPVEDYATRIKREYSQQARYAGYDRGHGSVEGSVDVNLENEYWRIIQK